MEGGVDMTANDLIALLVVLVIVLCLAITTKSSTKVHNKNQSSLKTLVFSWCFMTTNDLITAVIMTFTAVNNILLQFIIIVNWF